MTCEAKRASGLRGRAPRSAPSRHGDDAGRELIADFYFDAEMQNL